MGIVRFCRHNSKLFVPHRARSEPQDYLGLKQKELGLKQKEQPGWLLCSALFKTESAHRLHPDGFCGIRNKSDALVCHLSLSFAVG